MGGFKEFSNQRDMAWENTRAYRQVMTSLNNLDEILRTTQDVRQRSFRKPELGDEVRERVKHELDRLSEAFEDLLRL